MAWLGKIIGGSIGWALGGPLGAVAGAALGHTFDAIGEAEARTRGARAPELDALERSQYVFFVTTFSLLAKMAKADGVVTPEEIATVEAFIRRNLGDNARARELAIRIFREAKTSPHSFESFAEQFYAAFRHQPVMLLELFGILYSVAMADGVLHPNEQRLLDAAARIFRLSEDDARRIRTQFVPDDARYYEVLGCRPDDPMDVVKSRYRALTQQYHPDKVIAQGLPEEFVALANRKLQTINEAYDAIKKARQVS